MIFSEPVQPQIQPTCLVLLWKGQDRTMEDSRLVAGLELPVQDIVTKSGINVTTNIKCLA